MHAYTHTLVYAHTLTHRVLAAPPRPHTADADVNIAFQQAALKSTAQHDALFARFRIHWVPPQPPLVCLCVFVCRVGQNRIYTSPMTVYLVISLPKIKSIHRLTMVLANLMYVC